MNNGLAPEYLSNYFVERFGIHGRKTRRSGSINIPGCRLSLGQRAFYHQGINQWNSLAADLKLEDINSFKRGLLNVFYIRTNGLKTPKLKFGKNNTLHKNQFSLINSITESG